MYYIKSRRSVVIWKAVRVERGRTYLKLVPVFLQLNALAKTRKHGPQGNYLEANPANVAKCPGNGRHLDYCSMGVKLSSAVKRGRNREAIERGRPPSLTQVPSRRWVGRPQPIMKLQYLTVRTWVPRSPCTEPPLRSTLQRPNLNLLPVHRHQGHLVVLPRSAIPQKTARLPMRQCSPGVP